MPGPAALRPTTSQLPRFKPQQSSAVAVQAAMSSGGTSVSGVSTKLSIRRCWPHPSQRSALARRLGCTRPTTGLGCQVSPPPSLAFRTAPAAVRMSHFDASPVPLLVRLDLGQEAENRGVSLRRILTWRSSIRARAAGQGRWRAFSGPWRTGDERILGCPANDHEASRATPDDEISSRP